MKTKTRAARKRHNKKHSKAWIKRRQARIEFKRKRKNDARLFNVAEGNSRHFLPRLKGGITSRARGLAIAINNEEFEEYGRPRCSLGTVSMKRVWKLARSLMKKALKRDENVKKAREKEKAKYKR